MFLNDFFFSFWDMVDFVLNIRSELVWDLNEFRKKIMLVVSAPRPIMLLDWIPLVNWLAILNQVRKNVSPKSLQILSTKSIISQRLRKTHELKNPFQNIAHL